PEDMLESRATAPALRAPELREALACDAHAADEAARVIARAQRPLLIIGEDIRWSFDTAALRELVDNCGVPFITSPMGRGYMPDDHALCANEIRRTIQGRADVVVMAGAWFDWRFRFGTELAPEAVVIHADSDPATLGKNVPNAVTILSEPGEFLNRLAPALRREIGHVGASRFSSWHESLAALIAESRGAQQQWRLAESSPLQPQQLYTALRDVIPSDAIVAVEGNICLAAAQKVLRARQPASWIDPGRNGIIGGSIPFALGAKLASPERPVFALCSDTGFGMSAMDLEAAVRHRIAIVVVIANNEGNGGSVRQRNFFPGGHDERFCEFLPGLRYERIVEIFGGHAEHITDAAEIRGAVERALASGVVSCLNVTVDPQAPHSGIW
ncbi:MAG TPA: thiamine pyrophosphate-dependent enzyme, partial [Chthoniobacterales bacterium]